MKKLIFLSLLILAGCSTTSGDTANAPMTAQTQSVSTSVDGAAQTSAAQTTQTVQTTQTTRYAAAPAYTIQDDYFGPTYGTISEVQYVSQPQVAYETQTYTEQYQMQPSYTQTPQPMYAPAYVQNAPVTQQTHGQFVTQPSQGVVQQAVNPYYPYAPAQPVQNPMGNGSVIVLQNPMTRELVRCDFTDYNCVGSFESQGYVQLRAAPHFAGYNDVPSATDYPPRRYRDNNNIPRW